MSLKDEYTFQFFKKLARVILQLIIPFGQQL